jgi:hypothetical protein
MNKIIAIEILLIIAVVLTGIKQELNYPKAWDEIHLGMSRQEVYELIGPGIDEHPEWKGPFWMDSGLLVENEIEVYFTNDKATHIVQQQLFVTRKPFRTIRAEVVKFTE